MRAEVVEQLLLCPLWFSTIIHLLVERLRSANEIVARNRIRASELTEIIEKVLADGDSAFVRPVNDMQPFPVVEPDGSVEFRRGDIVLNEGDPGGFFYFIRSGKLGVFKDYHGDRIPLAQLKRLQVVGEMAVVDGKSRCATTVALTDVDLMRITKRVRSPPNINRGRVDPDDCRAPDTPMHHQLAKFRELASNNAYMSTQFLDRGVAEPGIAAGRTCHLADKH